MNIRDLALTTLMVACATLSVVALLQNVRPSAKVVGLLAALNGQDARERVCAV